MRRFEYEGPVYIRPIGRGVVLEDIDTYLTHAIEDLVGAGLGDWNGQMRIVVEIMDASEPDDGDAQA